MGNCGGREGSGTIPLSYFSIFSFIGFFLSVYTNQQRSVGATSSILCRRWAELGWGGVKDVHHKCAVQVYLWPGLIQSIQFASSQSTKFSLCYTLSASKPFAVLSDFLFFRILVIIFHYKAPLSGGIQCISQDEMVNLILYTPEGSPPD